MKESTHERIKRAAYAIENTCFDEDYDAKIESILTLFAKEQDRDTRHACAHHGLDKPTQL
jgi:hypothetical protein